jgi:hypothetical protein
LIEAAPGSYRVEIARTVEDVERLRPVWERIPWQREEAAYEYFLTRLHTRPEVLGPFAVIVSGAGGPVAALAGRLESRQLKTALGYKVVYAPRARILHVVDGGIVVTEVTAVEPLLSALRSVLASAEADAIGVPPLGVESELYAALNSLGGRFERQPLIGTWTRRRLALPGSFEEFVASRSANTRWRIRRDAKRLGAAFGERLSVEIVRTPEGLERLVADADRVARSTYQRALGAGFSDTPEQRALAAVGLAHGWVRGYLLYLDADPIAYWLCSVYDGTILIRTAGFDNAYAEHRVGVYLLMRVIEDACADPSLHVLDFGPGDAAYKQQFSSESRQERNLVIFAPTFRARRINVTRTLILAPAWVARRILDETQLTDRVKASWRRRLRGTR